MLGWALQTAGQGEEAVRRLTGMAEREAERIDAGSIRAWFGLLLVHRQAGNFTECEARADQMLALAERHDLPVAAGWARLFLGWIAYEHDELEAAIAHFSAIVADHLRVHLSCAVEGMLGLALAYQAKGMTFEADNTMRRVTGDRPRRAGDRLHPDDPGVRGASGAPARAGKAGGRVAVDARGSTSIAASSSASSTRCSPGSRSCSPKGRRRASPQARRHVDELRARAEAGHHVARLAEILALAALVLEAQGQGEAAVTELRVPSSWPPRPVSAGPTSTSARRSCRCCAGWRHAPRRPRISTAC